MELVNSFEIKVFILYLLKNINEPLEYTTVNDIVVQDGFVNYFDFAIAFSELLEAGQILEVKSDDKDLYVISPDGAESVSNVESTLYRSIKERALRSALRLIALYRTGNRITSRIVPLDCGGFTLECDITDNQKTLLRTDVYLTDEEYAKKLKHNFDERAEIIYKGVLALLEGDINFIFDE